MKIRPVGDKLFHADGRAEGWTVGRTDVPKLMVDIRNFANALKN
jgi:hypothetical protein